MAEKDSDIATVTNWNNVIKNIFIKLLIYQIVILLYTLQVTDVFIYEVS